jgi:hypothetical protein
VLGVIVLVLVFAGGFLVLEVRHLAKRPVESVALNGTTTYTAAPPPGSPPTVAAPAGRGTVGSPQSQSPPEAASSDGGHTGTVLADNVNLRSRCALSADPSFNTSPGPDSRNLDDTKYLYQLIVLNTL